MGCDVKPDMMQLMQMSWGKGKGGMMMAMMGGKGGKGVSQYDSKLKVWIGNLPSAVTWKDLQSHFNQVGKTKWVEIMPKGIGCVVYASKEDVDAAIAQLNGTELGGAAIQVDQWTKK